LLFLKKLLKRKNLIYTFLKKSIRLDIRVILILTRVAPNEAINPTSAFLTALFKFAFPRQANNIADI